MNADLALFQLDSPGSAPDSQTTREVRALIQEIEDEGRMSPRIRVYSAQALKYAGIMDQPKSAIAAVQAGIQLTDLIETHLTVKADDDGDLAALVALFEGDPYE